VSRRAYLVPLALLFAGLAVLGGTLVVQRIEETPRIPYELAEYAGIGAGDLGTEALFDDPGALEVRVRAARPGRVRFAVFGDAGTDEDPGKRALSRVMRDVCRRGGCDFVVFTGDNVYTNGVDTFGALADSLVRGIDLRGSFLEGVPAPGAAALAARVRGAAGLVARACAGAADPAPAGGDAAVLLRAAGEARGRHLEPKFDRTFRWLAEEGIPAFGVLGNHDWRSPFGSECQIGWSLRADTAWRIPNYWYAVRVEGPPQVRLLFLYSAPPHGRLGGENLARIGARQRVWLDATLAGITARSAPAAEGDPGPGAGGRTPWIVALSHHPYISAGGHTLREYGSFHADLAEAFGGAGLAPDLLLAGHNHWLEAVPVVVAGAPALQIVSGAFSKAAFYLMLPRGYPFVNLLALDPAWRDAVSVLGMTPAGVIDSSRSALTRGFAVVELERDRGTVRFYGIDGEIFRERVRRAPRPASAGDRRTVADGRGAAARRPEGAAAYGEVGERSPAPPRDGGGSGGP
jgi:hypothetical protein